MTTTTVLFLMLVTKHFIADLPLHSAHQYIAKGRYGHPDGVNHALIHGVLTTVCFAIFTNFALILGMLDAIIHYHIDWVERRVTKCKRLPQLITMYSGWVGHWFHVMTYGGLIWAMQYFETIMH